MLTIKMTSYHTNTINLSNGLTLTIKMTSHLGVFDISAHLQIHRTLNISIQGGDFSPLTVFYIQP